MFFSHFVLAKKGPLARIWLAAHWDKKLTKAHILEINIERSVEGILQPKIKLALRTSGHLLLGVVRIYSRKAKYLLAECNEAFVKIKMAFRPGVVDLPEGNREAALATITLPEVFHDFENISDIRIEVNTPTTLHQSRAEDITLKEDYGTLSLLGEDGFDMGFDDPEMARDATNIDEGFDQTGLLMPEEEQPTAVENAESNLTESVDPSSSVLPNGDIEKELETNENANTTTPGLFETGLFEDAPLTVVPPLEASEGTSGNEPPFAPCEPNDVEMSDDDTYGGPPSVGLPCSSPESVVGNMDEATEIEPHIAPNPQPVEPVEDAIQLPIADEAFNQNESESFALGPLETALHKGPERAKSKRKRKLIIDEVKNISGEEMKAQLSDTRDIISTLDLAPPTKRLMHWKESGGVEKLFALPGRPLQSKTLSRLYMRHLTTRPMHDELFEIEDPCPALEDMKSKEAVREAPRSSKRLRQMNPDEELEQPVVEQPPEVPPAAPAEEPHVVEGTSVVPEAPAENLDADVALNEQNAAKADVPNPEVSEIPETEPETQAETEKAAPVVEPEAENVENSEAPEAEKEPTNAESLFDQIVSDQQAPATTEVNAEKPEQSFLALDDDDDYHDPASAGPPEEQMYDETYEQFEERIHGKRATHMLQIMKRNLDAGNRVPFSALTRGNIRKQVAQKFYTLLVLKKQQAVELEQSSPYEEIYISRGPLLDDLQQ